MKLDNFVYLLATSNGRHGDVYMARVHESALLDSGAYEYWDSSRWSSRMTDAHPIGELSCGYSSYYRSWLLLSLDEDLHAIVLRTADELTGPWSKPAEIVSGRDFPGLYGDYIDPTHLDSPAIYFTMSQWQPYNVYWMRADLQELPDSAL